MILMIAPYDGVETHKSLFIAAAKKIKLVLSALKEIDEKIVLLNSGHQSNTNKNLTVKSVNLKECGLIDIITPPTKENKKYGRILNIYNMPTIINEVINQYGVPKLVWCYNGYAFEMKAASIIGQRYGVKIILGFEDWHFSRKRGINPKPYLDWLYWRKAIRYINYGFSVNSYLANKLSKYKIANSLLPGIVTPEIVDLAVISPPFNSTIITVGYFGGLTLEKGAGVFLKLVNLTKKNIYFIATGSGELEEQFKEMMRVMPNRFKYLGTVSDEELIVTMGKVDIIINAHNINEGIFPFKVIEALASCRMLISTKLPMNGFEKITKAIQFYDGSIEEIIKLIGNSPEIYKSNKHNAIFATEYIGEKYSIKSLKEDIRNILK